MSGVQGLSGVSSVTSYAISVMKLEQDTAKRDGAAQTELIDAVGQVVSSHQGGNAEGVGQHVDVIA